MKRKFSLMGIMLAAIILLTSMKVDAATDWNNGVIQATGTGVPTTGAIGAQARILARRAAIADAQRNLLELTEGVQVDAETTVEMMMVTSDIIRTKVSGVLKGARIVSEKQLEGVAEAVLERPAEVIPFPAPQPTKPSNPSITITVNDRYSGVVIDCRGMNLNPVMSPVIKNSRGEKLYGHKNLNPDYVIANGMAGYAHDMSMATRAGSNPLVIKAERLEDHNANPVISVDDGNLMLLENNSGNFLASTNVVFLY